MNSFFNAAIRKKIMAMDSNLNLKCIISFLQYGIEFSNNKSLEQSFSPNIWNKLFDILTSVVLLGKNPISGTTRNVSKLYLYYYIIILFTTLCRSLAFIFPFYPIQV